MNSLMHWYKTQVTLNYLVFRHLENIFMPYKFVSMEYKWVSVSHKFVRTKPSQLVWKWGDKRIRDLIPHHMPKTITWLESCSPKHMNIKMNIKFYKHMIWGQPKYMNVKMQIEFYKKRLLTCKPWGVSKWISMRVHFLIKKIIIS